MAARKKISILCFDVADNAISRATFLATAIASRYEVEVLGPSRSGAVWLPVADCGIAIRQFPWRRHPGFSGIGDEILGAADGDVVIAVKLRPTSYGLALKAKRTRGVPVILDIDDWELGFYLGMPWPSRILRWLDFSNPNSLLSTARLEKAVSQADAVTVSNRFLQERFGGEIVYHCRDTAKLNPALFDRAAIREELGLADKKVVGFIGTPRSHKGIDILRDAFTKVSDAHKHLLVVGGQSRRTEFTTTLGPVPLDEIPKYLVAADVIVIPQRSTPETRGQMPAKIFEAMAMGRPIVSTAVSDIPSVLAETGYIVPADDARGIARQVDHVFANPEEAATRGAAARERCRSHYDLAIMGNQIGEVIERLTP